MSRVCYFKCMNTYKKKAGQLIVIVKDLSRTMTDRQIAERFRVKVERVKKARQRLGLKKAGYRHKVKVV